MSTPRGGHHRRCVAVALAAGDVSSSDPDLRVRRRRARRRRRDPIDLTDPSGINIFITFFTGQADALAIGTAGGTCVAILVVYGVRR
jgi:hypothetical protein